MIISTTNIITTIDRMRLKPGLCLLSFMPDHQPGGMGIITRLSTQASSAFSTVGSSVTHADMIAYDN